MKIEARWLGRIDGGKKKVSLGGDKVRRSGSLVMPTMLLSQPTTGLLEIARTFSADVQMSRPRENSH